MTEETELKPVRRAGGDLQSGNAGGLCVQSCLFPQRVGGKRSRCHVSWEKRGAESQPVPALPALSPARARGCQVRGSPGKLDHEMLLGTGG